jgi:hypothetical protein
MHSNVVAEVQGRSAPEAVTLARRKCRCGCRVRRVGLLQHRAQVGPAVGRRDPRRWQWTILDVLHLLDVNRTAGVYRSGVTLGFWDHTRVAEMGREPRISSLSLFKNTTYSARVLKSGDFDLPSQSRQSRHSQGPGGAGAQPLQQKPASGARPKISPGLGQSPASIMALCVAPLAGSHQHIQAESAWFCLLNPPPWPLRASARVRPSGQRAVGVPRLAAGRKD